MMFRPQIKGFTKSLMFPYVPLFPSMSLFVSPLDTESKAIDGSKPVRSTLESVVGCVT